MGYVDFDFIHTPDGAEAVCKTCGEVAERLYDMKELIAQMQSRYGCRDCELWNETATAHELHFFKILEHKISQTTKNLEKQIWEIDH